jgi:hypothetical protein
MVWRPMRNHGRVRVRVRAWACGGLAVVVLTVGGCTSTSSGPVSSLGVVPPRCPDSLSFGVSAFAEDGAPGPIGASSPVAAARAVADDGLQPRIPRSGWHEGGQSTQGVTVVSGNTSLFVVQLANGRWTVQSVKTCT